MKLLSGLWRRFRNILSRSSQSAVNELRPDDTGADGDDKDMAEMRTALSESKPEVAEQGIEVETPGEEAKPQEIGEAIMQAAQEEETVEKRVEAQEPEKEERQREVKAEQKKEQPVIEMPVKAQAEKKLEPKVETKKEEPKVVAQPAKQPEKKPQAARSPVSTSPAASAAKPPRAEPVIVQGALPKIPSTTNGRRPKPSTTNDPQRLARLLVSEIKLYNEKKVIEGRENNNLYDVLKRAIDQSLMHYRDTLGADADKLPDYFREELVNTLCEGDPAKLGPNFPS